MMTDDELKIIIEEIDAQIYCLDKKCIKASHIEIHVTTYNSLMEKLEGLEGPEGALSEMDMLRSDHKKIRGLIAVPWICTGLDPVGINNTIIVVGLAVVTGNGGTMHITKEHLGYFKEALERGY